MKQNIAEHGTENLIKLINELKLEIQLLKKQKKYGLVWEDKPEDIVLECKENIPVLKEIKTRKIISDGLLPTNLLIEGDNYHSLSALNYTHKNKIDVIYIDPPYNTGSTDWKYNNNYVDKSDQWKHSKWISFMNRRLLLAKNLLSKKGVLICAIDHNEQEALGLLLQEIFPNQNITCVTIIHNPAGIQGDNFSYSHEYAYFVYPSNGRSIGYQLREEGEEDVRNFRDVTGEESLREAGANCFYPIYFKNGQIIGFGPVSEGKFHPGGVNLLAKDDVIEIYPVDPQGIERKWRFARQTVESIKDELQVKYIKSRKIWDVIRIKNKFNYKTVWTDSKYSANNHGTQLLNQIIEPNLFSFPKSLYAVTDCIKAATNENKNAIILDFFAGSGTTGHAVLNLNKYDGGNRKFILCTNNENRICEEVTYERLNRIIKGFKNRKGEKVAGLGGNLSYYKTDLVNTNKLSKVTDESKVKITHQVGEMIAIREDTLNEKEKNEWWQIFEGHEKITAIYFKEDKTRIGELLSIIEEMNTRAVLYIFGWGKNEYKNEYSTKNIRVEDIPEPILEVYKEINRL